MINSFLTEKYLLLLYLFIYFLFIIWEMHWKGVHVMYSVNIGLQGKIKAVDSEDQWIH